MTVAPDWAELRRRSERAIRKEVFLESSAHMVLALLDRAEKAEAEVLDLREAMRGAALKSVAAACSLCGTYEWTSHDPGCANAPTEDDPLRGAPGEDS